MMQKNRTILIFLSIGILLIISIFFSFNKSHEYHELPKVKVKEENNVKQFALMLEQEDGKYKESTGELPTRGYIFNAEKSGCTDLNGKIIDKAIEYNYENYTVTLNTNKTSYCYLYYDIEPIVSYLVSKDLNNNLSKELTGGLYRYQGTYEQVNNNYICFGTYDKDICLANPDKYMYRIIGISNDGSLKLIKKEALPSGIRWGFNAEEWPDTEIFKAINGNTFLNNTDYITEEWLNKIKEFRWMYGDILYQEVLKNGEELYEINIGKKKTTWHQKEDATSVEGSLNSKGQEIKCTTTTHGVVGTRVCYSVQNDYWTKYIDAKIGLMYLYDYYLSFNNTTYCSGGCKDSWIHLSHNDEKAMSDETGTLSYEWTMFRQGYYISWGTFTAYHIAPEGTYGLPSFGWNNSVRPVFYLNNNIKLTGEGTLENPFQIEQIKA